MQPTRLRRSRLASNLLTDKLDIEPKNDAWTCKPRFLCATNVDKCTVFPLYTTAHSDHLREDMANISRSLDRLIDLGNSGPIAGDAVLVRYAGMRRMVTRASHPLRMVAIEFTGLSLATCPAEQRNERFDRLRAGLVALDPECQATLLERYDTTRPQDWSNRSGWGELARARSLRHRCGAE